MKTVTGRALKHQGDVSKVFQNQTIVLDNDDVIVLYSDKGTRVDEVRKNSHWISHYAAYKVLPKNGLYNFIIVEKENGNEYYCNLASTPAITDNSVDYIDYDIDIVLSPDGDITVYDVEEFHERRVQHNYPDDLVAELLKEQTTVEKALHERSGFFDPEFYQTLVKLRTVQ